MKSEEKKKEPSMPAQFLSKSEQLVTGLSRNFLVEGLIAAIKFPITSEPIYLVISRDRINLRASMSFLRLCLSYLLIERDGWSRFIVSNYLLVDRDKRVTRISELVFAKKSRVTRGCWPGREPRGRNSVGLAPRKRTLSRFMY